jgi:hypothetical protein
MRSGTRAVGPRADSSRRARCLLALYPRAWRARYGDEILALLADTGLGFGGSVDLLVGATREHLQIVVAWSFDKAVSRIAMAVVIGSVLTSVATVVAMLVALALGRSAPVPTELVREGFAAACLVRAQIAWFWSRSLGWRISAAELAGWTVLAVVLSTWVQIGYWVGVTADVRTAAGWSHSWGHGFDVVGRVYCLVGLASEPYQRALANARARRTSAAQTVT